MFDDRRKTHGRRVGAANGPEKGGITDGLASERNRSKGGKKALVEKENRKSGEMIR